MNHSTHSGTLTKFPWHDIPGRCRDVGQLFREMVLGYDVRWLFSERMDGWMDGRGLLHFCTLYIQSRASSSDEQAEFCSPCIMRPTHEFHETGYSVTAYFILKKKSFSDVCRKSILPNMIGAVTVLRPVCPMQLPTGWSSVYNPNLLNWRPRVWTSGASEIQKFPKLTVMRRNSRSCQSHTK